MRFILFISFLLFLFSCSEKKDPKDEPVSQTAALPEASSYPLELDMSDKAKDVVTHCQTCHTARYIEMQPKLSKKTWQKTVDKMIHAFGANIDSVTAGRIVTYLSNQ